MSIQFFRYFIVGGFSFIIDMSVLVLLTELGSLHYLISAGAGFICGLTTNYFLSLKWVFSSRSLKNKKLEFIIFALIGIAGLILNEFSLWFFTEILLLHYIVSKIITASLILFWNFFMRKILLFGGSKVNV